MAKLLRYVLSAFFLCLSLGLGQSAWAESSVLVTSSGQALDAFTVKTMLTQAGVENQYDAVAEVDALDGIDTLIIAVGASVKGFGAAGITADSEKERTQALLDEAKDQGIQVIAVHIGGSDRRGGLSEQFVTLVAEQADALVVTEEGDEDNYFSELAEERDIPLTVINLPMGVGKALAELIDD